MKIKEKLVNFKILFSHRLQELKYYLYHFFKDNPKNSTRVLIFAQGRTGSTLLESLICSTGHFKRRGEILGGIGTKTKFPYHYVSGFSKMTNDNFIFHLKIYHLTRDRKKEIDPAIFLRNLYNDGWKIIYLQRRNKLKHFLSNKIAETRGGFHKYDKKKEKYSFNLPPSEVLQGIKGRIEFENFELEALRYVDYLKITYEDDLLHSESHQNTVNKILDYIGLERKECHTQLVKINQQPLNDIIQNYTEVINFLKENNMSKHIYDTVNENN